MNYRIILVDKFKKEAKKLLKKYTSLKEELQELKIQLLENPTLGTLIYENTYKIRLAVKSKGKGKSGGLRVITHIFEVVVDISEENKEQETIIFLLSIYDKSDVANLSKNYIKSIISDIEDELDDEEE